MASLHKNGTEIARLTVHEDDTSTRREWSYRSNGAILYKLTIDGHNYGWKVENRFREAFRRDPAKLRVAIARHCHNKRDEWDPDARYRVEVTGLPAAGA